MDREHRRRQAPSFLNYANYDFTQPFRKVTVLWIPPDKRVKHEKPWKKVGRSTLSEIGLNPTLDPALMGFPPNTVLDPPKKPTKSRYEGLKDQQREFHQVLDRVIQAASDKAAQEAVHRLVAMHCPKETKFTLRAACCYGYAYAKAQVRRRARKERKTELIQIPLLMVQLSEEQLTFWQELHLWLNVNPWNSLSRCGPCGRYMFSKTKRRRKFCSDNCRQVAYRAEHAANQETYRKYPKGDGQHGSQRIGH